MRLIIKLDLIRTANTIRLLAKTEAVLIQLSEKNLSTFIKGLMI